MNKIIAMLNNRIIALEQDLQSLRSDRKVASKLGFDIEVASVSELIDAKDSEMDYLKEVVVAMKNKGRNDG